MWYLFIIHPMFYENAKFFNQLLTFGENIKHPTTNPLRKIPILITILKKLITEVWYHIGTSANKGL